MVISVSARRLLAKCPHLYELRYIAKKKGKPENERNFMDGSIIHEIIAEWFTANCPTAREFFNPDKVRDKHKAFLTKHYVKWLASETESSHLEKTVDKARRTAVSLTVIPFERLGERKIEQPIKAMIDNNPYWELYGYVDLWFTEKRAIFDFKITESKQWFDWDQLLFYLLLASFNTNKPHYHGGIIAPLFDNPVFDKTYTIEDFRRLRSELKGEFDRIFRWLKSRREGGEGFPANKSDENCKFCPYKNAGCKAWSMRALHHGVWADGGGYFGKKSGTGGEVPQAEITT